MTCEGCAERREKALAWMRGQIESLSALMQPQQIKRGKRLTRSPTDASPSESSETSKQGKG